MPAPPDLRKQLAAKATKALESLIDEIWDSAADVTFGQALDYLQHAMAQARNAAVHAPEPVRDNPFGQGRLVYDHPSSIAAMTPQKRGALDRAPKGMIKGAIKDLIYNAGPEGITAAQIRDVAKIQKGITIKEGSMKQGLRLLQRDEAIERKGTLYFPKKSGGPSDD